MKHDNFNANFELKLFASSPAQIKKIQFRDLTVVDDGTFLLPSTSDAKPKTASKNWSSVYDLIDRQVFPSGPSRKFAAFDFSNAELVRTLDYDPDSMNETTIMLGTDVTLENYQFKNILLSNYLVQDSTAVDLLPYLLSALEPTFKSAISDLIIHGNGHSMEGILDSQDSYQVFNSSATLTYDNLVDMSTALSSQWLSDAVWAMNLQTLNQVRKIKDTNGRPIFNDYDGTPAGLSFVGSLLGFPVKLVPELPTYGTATYGSIIFGSFSNAYTLLQAPPAQFNTWDLYSNNQPFAFIVDRESYATSNSLSLIPRTRLAGIRTTINSAYSPLVIAGVA
jgi:HK97 family phage major capsid protein